MIGCAAEALPAAETAEAEQGQRSVFCESAATLEAKAGHRNPEGTATRTSAPVFASALRGAPQKSAKRKRTIARFDLITSSGTL